jgi:hypothetical protein
MTPKKKSKKKNAKPKTALRKKAAPKKKARTKKAAPRKKPARNNRAARGKKQKLATVTFEPRGLGANSGGQSGDLQGLSNSAGADSESVDELLEEGNAFEAEVVEGVENAPDADQGEVRTHEVLENDVPDEYLDKDK